MSGSNSNAPAEVLVAIKRVVSARVARWPNRSTLNDPVVIGEHTPEDIFKGKGLAAHLFPDTMPMRLVDGQRSFELPVVVAVVGKIDTTSPATDASPLLAMLAAWFDLHMAIQSAYDERADGNNAFTPFAHLTLTAPAKIESGTYRELDGYWAIGGSFTFTTRADPATFAALKRA